MTDELDKIEAHGRLEKAKFLAVIEAIHTTVEKYPEPFIKFKIALRNEPANPKQVQLLDRGTLARSRGRVHGPEADGSNPSPCTTIGGK